MGEDSSNGASVNFAEKISSTAKIDSSLDNLFKQSKPISRPAIKEPTKITLPSTNENADENIEEGVNIEAEKKVSKEKKKQSKKKKSGLDGDNLEADYFDKLREEEAVEKDTGSEEEKKSPKDEKEEEKSENDKQKSEQEKLEQRALKHQQDVKIQQELQKSEKTIFVNNLPSKVVLDKHEYKAFSKHFRRFGAINSIRFRSLAFSEFLPRKVAFLEKKLHAERDTVNAYIVYDEASSARNALSLNATVFMDRHLRVDSVSHPMARDVKRCIFVGNLAFEAEEEPLWRYFGQSGEIEYVRIVRDPKTNLGKGFAYIQFKEPLSVEKALLLNEKQMPEGRTLRVSRAKVIKANAPASTAKPNNQKGRTLQGRARKLMGKAGNALVKENLSLEGHHAKPGENPLVKKKKPSKKRKERADQWKQNKSKKVKN
ncbi:RNA-binding protein Nop12 [Schizosaccharomyces cryophilus OY26]|uniref:Nucleolar protein 12 n=1 Tax=Schizosaccharomyces cryophilus (strain OY26 / ATCC MYA-4695 / CBS 11777 / NBRC 106824 / NRRL Y48691) TaxID=653667 RepID=S9XGE3_SCHCR|nr:RNA-binding protein Nop12 [Schizosaccharomyces cryophilus OY26]EPY52746.1 RNA-binding protein Nop12 [Schizosaccharomyces cryophilus OY26]